MLMMVTDIHESLRTSPDALIAKGTHKPGEAAPRGL